MCAQRPPTIVATTSTSGSSSGRDRERVAVEHDEVGEVPGEQLAAAALLAREPGRREDRRLERLLDRDRLLRMPRLALVERAEHPGADPGQRLELLDRRVGAVRDHRARVEQRAVGVRAVGHPGPVAVGDVAVGRGVAELDGRGDAELGEAGDVLLGQELRVLDPRPEPERRPLVAGLLEGVERVAVREVADRVHRDRPAGARAGAHDLGELLAARDLDARSRRAVAPSASPASRP